MKSIKKFMSVFIVFSMILGVFGTFPVLAATNLIKNGGFENGATDWAVAEGTMYATGKTQVAGKACAKVIERKQNYSTPQQYVNMVNGKTYTISLWVKLESGTDVCELVAEAYNDEGKKVIPICSKEVGTEWTQLKQTFTLNYQPGFTKIKVFSKINSLVNAYFDEFELWEGSSLGGSVAVNNSAGTIEIVNPELENTATPDLTKINLISNSDLNFGDKGYNANNADIIYDDGKGSGVRSLCIKPKNGGSVTVNVDMINGKGYYLNIWYKGQSISVSTNGETQVAKGELAEEWTLLSNFFTYYGFDGKPYISIESDGEFYLSSVSLFEVSEALYKSVFGGNEDSARLLPGGGFEEGVKSDGWIGSNWKVTDQRAHTGAYSALASNRANNYDGPQYNVTLEKNTDYYISAWVYCDSTVKARMRLQGTGIASGTEQTLAKGEWQKVSAILNSGDATSGKVYVQTGDNSTIFVDDIEFYKYNKNMNIEDESQTSLSDVPVNPEGLSSEDKVKAYDWDFSCFPGTAHILAGWQVVMKGVGSSSYYSVKAEEENGFAKLNFWTPSPTIRTMNDKSLGIDAKKFPYISIKLKNNTSSRTGTLAWTVEGDPNTHSIKFEWKNNHDEISETIIDLSQWSDWQGTIKQIYLTVADTVEKDIYGWAKQGESVVLQNISVFSDEVSSGVTQVTGDALNRAEFVDILVNAIGIINYNGDKGEILDVNKSAPWYKSFLSAYETGIVRGDGTGYFKPSTSITREQAAAMVIRACEYFEKQSGRAIRNINFDDDYEFSDGMKGYAIAARQLGFMTNKGENTFDPKGVITQQEAQDIASRVVTWIDGRTDNGLFISSDYAVNYDIVRITAEDPEPSEYNNPYDSEEVKTDAVFTDPNGNQLVVPGYYDPLCDYQYDPRRTTESFKQNDAWKFRFTPTMAGEWKFVVRLTDKNGIKELGSGTIISIDSDSKGFLKSDDDNPRIIYENGEPYFGVGINIFGPTGKDGSNFVTHEHYIEKYAQENGVNLMRVWFDNTTDSLESFDTGLGKFDNVYASQLDYMMRLTRQNGVKILASLKTHHFLVTSQTVASRSQYTSLLGGPLEFPAEVYSNQETKKAYKILLRFVIARYSAYDNLLLWEFWNEEEAITGWRTVKDDISKWHDEMLAYAKTTDPYHHIVGSSGKSPAGEDFLFGKPETDYTCLHSYNQVQPELMVRADALLKKEKYGNKPNLIEELSVRKTICDVDKEGAITHGSLWASLASGIAASCPPWWWDTWMDDNEHWKIYGPVTKFLEGFSWPDENIELINFKTTSAEKGDYNILSGYYERLQYGETPDGTTPIKTEFNYDFTQQLVPQIKDDLIFESVIEAGTEYTFNVNLPETTQVYAAIIGTPISSYTNGILQALVDGEEVYNSGNLLNNDYVTKHKFTIPAGKHTVVIRNASEKAPFWLGWIGFENVTSRVVAEGAVGENNSIIYVRDTKTVYSDMLYNNYVPPLISGATVELTGLKDGEYDLIWWDTYNGVEVSHQNIAVQNGKAPVVEVPTFSKDIAAKIMRKSN